MICFPNVESWSLITQFSAVESGFIALEKTESFNFLTLLLNNHDGDYCTSTNRYKR